MSPFSQTLLAGFLSPELFQAPWLCALSFFPEHKPLTPQLHDAMSFQVTSAALMCKGSVGGMMGHSQLIAGHWALPQFFTNLVFSLGTCLQQRKNVGLSPFPIPESTAPFLAGGKKLPWLTWAGRDVCLKYFVLQSPFFVRIFLELDKKGGCQHKIEHMQGRLALICFAKLHQ